MQRKQPAKETLRCFITSHTGQTRTMDCPIRDNTGSLLTKLNNQLEEWRNHFATLLNRDPPVDTPKLQVNHQLPINTANITKQEIKQALT